MLTPRRFPYSLGRVSLAPTSVDPSDSGTSPPNLVTRAAPTLFEGACTLIAALGAALVVFHLTESWGYVSAQRRALMMPFNLAPPANTIFRYGAFLLTLFASGALYDLGLFRRMTGVARGLDLFAGALMLALVWWAPFSGALVGAFVARALVGAGLASSAGGSFVARRPALRELAAWAPYVAAALLTAIFSLILPSGIPAAIVDAPAWLLVLVAAPLALYVVEEWLSPRALVWERRIGFVVVLVAIPCVTFRIAAAVFDFDTIIGPVNDIQLGKDILDSVVSTYGFLFNYALVGLFWLFRVKDLYIGLAVLNAVAYTVGYGLIFVFLSYRIRRLSLSLASMILVVGLHYFHLHNPITWLPQSGFLRFGGMLPIFLLLYALEGRESRRLEWVFGACAAVAMLWTIEVGGYIALGLAAALGHDLLFRSAGVRRALRLGAKTAASMAVVLLFFTARIKLRHGHWPFWGDLLHFQRAFSAGIAIGRVSTVERWPIPIAVSLVALFVAFRAPRSMRHGMAWSFLAVFGLAAMIYPIGKSPGIFELARVILPALLLGATLIGFLYDHREQLVVGTGDRRVNLSSAASVALLAATVALPCVAYVDSHVWLGKFLDLERTNVKPIAHATPSWQGFFPAPERRAQFELDLAEIRALVPADEGLPIISKNDTLYYVFAPRKALVKNSFSPHFFFKEDIDIVTNAILSAKCEYLFIDNSNFRTYENVVDAAVAREIWARLTTRYKPVRRAGLLDIFRRVPSGS